MSAVTPKSWRPAVWLIRDRCSKLYRRANMGRRKEPCFWCQRITVRTPRDAAGRHHNLYPTRDHHPIPESQGGTETVRSCLQCNRIKGNMGADAWSEFRRRHPKWWQNFDQNCAHWFCRDLARERSTNDRPSMQGNDADPNCGV